MIAKYCKKEHNILNGCQTIKLGTLREYRKNYPGFTIQDEEEGLAGFKSKPGERVVIDAKDADKIGLGLKKGTITFKARPSADGMFAQEFPNSYYFA